MCLIVFAWKLLPACPLILAANRDEFFERPTQPASWWEDAPHVYAGRDLQAGGTWLGTDKQGRFAALTNIRNGSAPRAGTRWASGIYNGGSHDMIRTNWVHHIAHNIACGSAGGQQGPSRRQIGL